MHKLILGKRNHAAQARILIAASILANHFDLPDELSSSLKVQEKDVEVRAMKEREAIANLLDAVVNELGHVVPGAVEETKTDASSDGEPNSSSVPPEMGDGLPEPIIDPEDDDTGE